MPGLRSPLAPLASNNISPLHPAYLHPALPSYPVMPTQPFRFLDLPPELRVMVYEQIHVTTITHELDLPSKEFTPWRNMAKTTSTIAMARESLETAILATCRLIHHEASSTFATKLQLMAAEPLRFRLDWSNVLALTRRNSPFALCFSAQHEFDPNVFSGSRTREFATRCFGHLERVRQLYPTRARGKDIELTITKYDSDIHTYGSEVMTALMEIV